MRGFEDPSEKIGDLGGKRRDLEDGFGRRSETQFTDEHVAHWAL